MKEVCNGKVNTSGICEKCYQLSQTTSGYCTRLIDVVPVEVEKQIYTPNPPIGSTTDFKIGVIDQP